MSVKDRVQDTSAVSNQAKVEAARRQAFLDKVVPDTTNNVNPQAGGGSGGSGGGSGGGTSQQQATGHSQQSSFTKNADDATKAAEPRPSGNQKPRAGVQRDVLKGKGASQAGGASRTTGNSPRRVQRPSLTPKTSTAFSTSTQNVLSQFHRARGTFRQGMKHLVRSFSLKSVLRGIARRAPGYLFRIFGATFAVVLYVLDSSEVSAGDYPGWYKRYRRFLAEYTNSTDPAAKMNALRKMNVIIYKQQENDSLAFIAVMTGLGEVLNKDSSKRAVIMKRYQDLVKNYKKSLRTAGETLAKNSAEGEKLYAETRTAYGWNQAYMQHMNAYHYPYVKKFKKISERYINLADRLRDDPTAASIDLGS